MTIARIALPTATIMLMRLMPLTGLIVVALWKSERTI